MAAATRREARRASWRAPGDSERQATASRRYRQRGRTITEAGATIGDIKDPQLAEAGQKRNEWAAREKPVMMDLEDMMRRRAAGERF